MTARPSPAMGQGRLTPAGGSRRRGGSLRLQRGRSRLAPYGLILPAFALFVLIWLIPIVRAAQLSLQTTVAGGVSKWVGFDNYAALARDPVVTQSLRNGGLLMLFIILPMTFGSFALGLLLNRASNRVRTIALILLIIPFITSPAMTSIVFRSIFDTAGFANSVLGTVGIAEVDWLGSANWARLAITVMVLWEFLGFNAVLVLAGLQRLAPEVFEAAEMDGASRFAISRKVTLPLMTPVIAFVAMGTAFACVNLFTEPLLLTQTGPGQATLTPGLLVYLTAFRFGHFESAAAFGLVLGAISAAAGYVLIKLSQVRS